VKGSVTFAAADPKSTKALEEEIRELEERLDTVQAELRNQKDGKKERGRKLSDERSSSKKPTCGPSAVIRRPKKRRTPGNT
jgi:hypothetical protein